MAERILITGSGGREHALGWKLQSFDRELFFTPGNAETCQLENAKNMGVQPTEVEKIADLAKDEHIDYVIVGPEEPLGLGIIDTLTSCNIPSFGPTSVAARLETSKAWAIDFMLGQHIPHPTTHTFQEIDEATLHVTNRGWKHVVIKVDGLAAGKGSVVPSSEKEAQDALIRMLVKKEFGKAGETVLVQERLTGEELSALAFSDGQTVVPLLVAQDYKRLKDNDEGPNTGGMGSFATNPPRVSKELLQKIHTTILQPTVDGMREAGTPFKGVLYAGLMLTKGGPKVLEYNVRFGDPETQPLMMLFSRNLLFALQACSQGTLHKDHVGFRRGNAVCVVLASEGYPENPKKGAIIRGLEKVDDPNIQVFHAGTIFKRGKYKVNGGRVLGITAFGATLQDAAKKAYSVIGKHAIHFRGMQYRTDIGIKYR